VFFTVMLNARTHTLQAKGILSPKLVSIFGIRC